ncbi:MAG: RNA polymerase sigma factor RpoD/SigA [Solirubrobacterales bacterium]
MDNDDGFALFLRQIGRTPLLTPDQEKALAFRCERGDLAAKERMIEANLRLVVHVAKRYQREDCPLTLPDLVQEGTLGLVRAVEKFDPRTGNRFSTYATIWIQQAIGRAIAEKTREIRVPTAIHQKLRKLDKLTSKLGREPDPEEAARQLGWTLPMVESVLSARHVVVSLNEPIGDTQVERGALIPADPWHTHHELDARIVSELLDSLSARERIVLEMRFGFNGREPATQAATGRRLGLKRTEVRRIEEYALSKLRHAPGVASLAAA